MKFSTCLSYSVNASKSILDSILDKADDLGGDSSEKITGDEGEHLSFTFFTAENAIEFREFVFNKFDESFSDSGLFDLFVTFDPENDFEDEFMDSYTDFILETSEMEETHSKGNLN